MDLNAVAEQRANAVAKLRRAASLPRMKDGRRPPMHGEAVSEGERTQPEDEKKGAEEEVAPQQEDPVELEEEEKPPERKTTETPDPPVKRRSRSRSRSRGSKDLKAKMRAMEPPLQSASPALSDGTTTDDQITSLPFSPTHDSPFLVSPTPSRFMQMQMTQAMLPPASPFHYPGTSPPTPMPTLEALQSRHLQGLFRSNSAAARSMAMHKLTGGTEPIDGSFGMMGSLNSPLPASRLGRNNTVAGGERIAARQLLLRRLNERIGLTDTEQSSDREDATTPTSRSRKRRSRRKSGSAGVVDDRDFTSTTSTNTPAATPAPLTVDLNSPPQPAHTQLSTPSPVPSTHGGSQQAAPQVEKEIQSNGTQMQYDTPLRRGVVVEEDEDEDEPPVRQTPPPRMHRFQGSPGTPLTSITHLRSHHSSDAPSTTSTDSNPINGLNVPLMLSESGRASPYRQDLFPKSPFGTPIKEETDGSKLRFPWTENTDREVSWVGESVTASQPVTPVDREISWVADLVPEARNTPRPERDVTVSWIAEPSLSARMPVHDEDEDEDSDEDDDAALETASTHESLDRRDESPRDSSASHGRIAERETLRDNIASYADQSHLSTATSGVRESDVSSASGIFSTPIEPVSSNDLARSRSQSSSIRGWDDSQLLSEATEMMSKRSTDASTSTWGRVKSTFSRSNSSTGRRSRTNSTATRDKRENTESSRESGASVVSGRRESKGDNSSAMTWQQAHTPLNQSPSASASILSLAPPPRGGVSPIPPPSDADSAKYANPKLFPFPGMVKLQEESLRTRGMSLSVSTPDISLSQSISSDRVTPSSTSSASNQTPEMVRDRKLSHQASDSRLLARYQNSPAPPVANAPSNGSQSDYFSTTPVSAGGAGSAANFGLKLPTTREGVKKWLSAKKFFSSQNSGGQATLLSPTDTRTMDAPKKPSLTDLLRKDVEAVSDWEDLDKPRAPTSASTSTIKGTPSSRRHYVQDTEFQDSSPDDPMATYKYTQSIPHTPEHGRNVGTGGGSMAYFDSSFTPLPSPADMNSSTTPDPASSADESPGPTLSQSSHASESSLSLQQSPPEQFDPAMQSLKSAEIIKRLDHVLRSDDLNKMWASAISSPPRRLLLSSPMLQVVNSNTVKDRFLFLFSDVLVIAKPIMPNRDSLLDNTRPYPPDRKFVVKSVVQLRDLRLNADRDDDSKRTTLHVANPRPAIIASFVEEFAIDPDIAVAKLLQHQGTQEGYTALGRLLVQLPEINKAKLGEYFSRRSSRHALRGYLDALGFTGMGIDTALRVLLLSLHIPSAQIHANALEYLLDTFAGRWYEANAGIVAFDKDLAVRLVRAIVRLNEALHSSMAHEGGNQGFSRHFVNAKDFTDAFRRHDPRSLVPDNTLEKIYASVRHEKLCQARNPSHGRALISVVLKRSLPSRLTYRRQSDPIVVRIPQVDPRLTIQLHGQDLVFDPPVLSFSKSAEASFRVTGTSLGMKSIVMASSGPSAPSYSGLPMSSTLIVERAFMRNTFQIAFLNHYGLKRKYMFSVDDPVIRHEWTSSLKRQIDLATSAAPPDLPAPAQVQIYRTAEALSFSVLRDSLLEVEVPTQQSTPTDTAMVLHDLSVSSTPQRQDSREQSSGASFARSKSRSRMYRLGPGKVEQDLQNGPQNDSADMVGVVQMGVRLWTSHELELLCQQNSSIALVLSFLQAALPYDADEEFSGYFPPTTPQLENTIHV